MKDGIYKVVFDSNVNRNGQCDGIISVRDNHVNGGDYVCYYQGVLKDNVIALKVVRHNPHDTTVFNGVDNVELLLAVKDVLGGTIFEGKVTGRNDLTLTGRMTYLSELM